MRRNWFRAEPIEAMGAMQSIWLVPKEPERERLRNLIERVAKVTGGPLFEPHITILGDIPLPASEINRRIGSCIRAAPGFRLMSKEIGVGKSYFESLFLMTELHPVVSELNRLVSSRLPSSSNRRPFVPHVSLAYGRLEPEKMGRIMEIAGGAHPVSLEFDELSIFCASKSIPLEKWFCRETIPFRGRSRDRPRQDNF